MVWLLVLGDALGGQTVPLSGPWLFRPKRSAQLAVFWKSPYLFELSQLVES
jgi:hypothetical protein